MSNHTPGPWISEPGKGGEDFNIFAPFKGDQQRMIVYIATAEYTGFEGQVEANARLMAAAPDMLEALKLAKRFIAESDKRTGQELSVFRDAIEKAGG